MSCLCRIDYRMTGESFAESRGYREKFSAESREKKNIVMIFFFFILFFAALSIRIYISLKSGAVTDKFTYTVANCLIILAFLMLAGKLFEMRLKKKNKNLFIQRGLAEKPCYMELYDDFFRYCVDGAEIKESYCVIEEIMITGKTMTAIGKNSSLCISIPKDSTDNESWEKFLILFSEKTEKFAEIKYQK